MSRNQIIGSSASANVDFGRGGAYQITVAIECVQESRGIGVGVRLDALQCVFAYEERCLNRAVVPPKSHGAPRRVIRTTVIWKINHVIDAGQAVAGPCRW